MPRLPAWRTILTGLALAALYVAVVRIGPQVPVVIVSGYSRADAVSAIGAGRDGEPQSFLQKPFGPRELADAVRAALGR